MLGFEIWSLEEIPARSKAQHRGHRGGSAPKTFATAKKEENGQTLLDGSYE